jgi:hypothetical protein
MCAPTYVVRSRTLILGRLKTAIGFSRRLKKTKRAPCISKLRLTLFGVGVDVVRDLGRSRRLFKTGHCPILRADGRSGQPPDSISLGHVPSHLGI